MRCEVCDTGFYIEKYGDGVCPSCGTEYRYDEGTNVYLSAEQCQLLKTGRQDIEALRAELARLRETVAELESERDYWREWGLEARRAERARIEGHSTPVKVVIGRHDIAEGAG